MSIEGFTPEYLADKTSGDLAVVGMACIQIVNRYVDAGLPEHPGCLQAMADARACVEALERRAAGTTGLFEGSQR